jgi:hypothetical protein
VILYRTEIVIPADRYLCLQLPPSMREGRATVTVTVLEDADASEPIGSNEIEDDRVDIEWWGEFEDEGEPVA